MRQTEEDVSWVVYMTTASGKPGKTGPVNAVCGQSEWDALERDAPGTHTLVQGGITSEGEAERLARGASGDARRTGYGKR